ncbi:hypothetical protein [Bergeyella sp. RCAD1439]|uniref:hypothetical protein n=1 Tax=Bergeyella anatis TaxID=3113737 RepID=UPI002E18B837|nr:hypothetical protein [Bergeyella sp. RCAD1439]
MKNRIFTFNLQTFKDFEDFENWLKILFYLNDSLQKEYDLIYQDSFYVKIYELLNDGLAYSQKILKNCHAKNETQNANWYSTLITQIENIQNQFSEEELQYIEYRRNKVCHIFLSGYDRIKKDLSINKKRKNIDLEILQSNLYKVISKLEHLENPNLYFNNKIHPILNDLYKKLITTANVPAALRSPLWERSFCKGILQSC